MAIPPFPPQDLAKLVLGYLAEEELMTTYDEFLQASPYLDAFRNEYDRIFMKSLRSILADYRAVRIHVETCKPNVLRKKLLQCSNLLDIVKFLINIIDLQKLNGPDIVENVRLQKSNISRGTICEACYSLNLKSCVCKSNVTSMNLLTKDHPIVISNLLEATPLEDLPGNLSSKTKSKLEDTKNVCINDQKEDSGPTCHKQEILSSTTTLTNNYVTASSFTHSHVSHIPQIPKTNCMDSKQKMEFNSILNLVCNKSVTNDKLCDNLVSNAITNRVSSDGSFQDFSSGVNDNKQEKVKHVPDSSTSEMYIMPHAPTASKEMFITNIKGPPNHIFNQPIINLNSPSNFTEKCIIKDGIPRGNEEALKVMDNKIRILSDVKFDSKYNTPSMPAISKITTTVSTPSCLPKHTLIINGTPANRQKGSTICSYNYSKDEIMAMPTLIIVPTSGPYNIVSTTANSTTNIENNKTLPNSDAPIISPKLKPLYIEVPSENVGLCENNKKDVSQSNGNDVSLVKTVEMVTHASLPKDSTVLCKTNTPHVLPPLRKSSSTPRRTSHVRVLDFTTPRRILDEAIPEKENTSEDNVVVIPDSPIRTESDTGKDSEKVKMEANLTTDLKKEKKVEKKRNWDEGLRALIAANEDPFKASQPKSSRKSKSNKTKVIRDTEEDSSKKESTKEKKTKKKIKPADYVEEPKPIDLNIDKPIKPTINIISAPEHVCPTAVESDKKQNKSNEIVDPIDTPETERLSLQNVIGAKLNISDLLETPYKQAIYDIQMETPRFLGPDIPGEPESDIKIMNIPTPRFFDTPKPTQATPSSYSSRPTDYSSGGSYYKPDDQDYIPSIEVVSCAIITETKSKESKDKVKNVKSKETSCKETRRDSCTDIKSSKTRRPVRKCTKNVSYYNSPNINNSNKTKDVSDSDTAEVANVNSSQDKTIKTPKNKSMKAKTIKSKMKPEKYKSPFKKDTPKNFMKIKPRRLTPVKDGSAKNRKTSSDLLLSARKKNIKEKAVNSSMQTLTVVPSKSRRKSSTPRKLHCNKTFHSSSSSNHSSPEVPQEKKTEIKDINICITHDSDSEQQPLRWSDDGSQDAKAKDNNESSIKEGEDIIVKIQEYIETIESKITSNTSTPSVGSLQSDLIRRGFDIETAKIIERDLLDTPPIQDGVVQSTSNDNNEDIREVKVLREGEKLDSNIVNTSKKVEVNKNIDDEKIGEEADDIDFTAVETNEQTNNYFIYEFDEANYKSGEDVVNLKDKYCMEFCIDNGVTIRLRATQFSVMLDQEPVADNEYNKKEIEAAVTSISTIDKLYTPIKDPRMQCFELFDSTLTSIDTPLKAPSPKGRECESSITEIVLEVENISSKAEGKKRRRLQSGASDEGSNSIKRNKPDPQYLLNQANIQNIDIESVLSKLHGP